MWNSKFYGAFSTRLISTQVAAREVHEVGIVQGRAPRRPVQSFGAVGAEDGVRAATAAKRLGVAPLVRRVVKIICTYALGA